MIKYAKERDQALKALKKSQEKERELQEELDAQVADNSQLKAASIQMAKKLKEASALISSLRKFIREKQQEEVLTPKSRGFFARIFGRGQ